MSQSQKVLASFQSKDEDDQYLEKQWQYAEARWNVRWALKQLAAIQPEVHAVREKRRRRYAIFPFPFNLLEQGGYTVLEALERTVTKLVLRFVH